MQVFTVDQNWMSLKNQFKHHWSLLSDSQVEKGKSSFDELVEEIQASYGMSPKKAEEELTHFLFEDPVKKEMEKMMESELM